HGVHKLFHGIAGVQSLVIAKGMPGFFAYGVYVGEVIAPLLVLVGWYARPAALVVAFNMLVAVGLAHGKDVLRLGAQGQPGIELQLLYFLGAGAGAHLGPGRYAMSPRPKRSRMSSH